MDRKLEVMVQGKDNTVQVNVKDTCADADCEGCCSQNTGDGKWTLIDIEKWPASELLGFDPDTADVNDVSPSAKGKRPGAGGGVMALCYRDVGPADPIP